MCTGTSLLYKIPRVVVGENVTFRSTGEHLFPQNNVEVVLVQDERCIQVTFIEFAQLHWIVIKLYLSVLNLSPSLIVGKCIIFRIRPKLFSVFVATKLRCLTNWNYFRNRSWRNSSRIALNFGTRTSMKSTSEWKRINECICYEKSTAIHFRAFFFWLCLFFDLTVTIVFHQADI